VKTWTVHTSAGAEPVLVQEGFSLGAAIFGALWLLVQRAWIPAVLFLCVQLAAGWLLPPALRAPAALMLAWIAGVFGRDLVRWSLERRGFVLEHVVAASSEDLAVGRILTAWPDLITALSA
jgi:hypothetical protein